MKSPHEQDEYKRIDEPTSDGKAAGAGSYWYVDIDQKKLAETGFIRTLLTIIAFMLQLIVLALRQECAEYVTAVYPSLAYTYVWFVFVVLGIAIWLFVMNATRYKFQKRIPAKHAPRSGFCRRAFFGAELYMVSNAVPAIFELIFVCIYYDGIGLLAFFICLLATAVAVAAREVTRRTLRSATLISEVVDEEPDAPAQPPEQNEPDAENTGMTETIEPNEPDKNIDPTALLQDPDALDG